jgi:hypothetical protein
MMRAAMQARHRRFLYATSLLALLLAGIMTLWTVVSLDGPEARTEIHQKLSPEKTRSALRGAPIPSTESPQMSFHERIREGIDLEEINWILDDFRAVGLDRPPTAGTGEDYLNYRRTQQRWYLSALDEALQLSPGQRAVTKQQLDKLYQGDAASYVKLLAGMQPITLEDGRQFLIGSAHDFNSILSATSWIFANDGKFLPQNLCELTPDQLEILSPTRAVGLGTGFQELENLLPYAGQLPPDLLGDHPWDSEALAMVLGYLHPAQLKLLLLMNPSLTDQIAGSANGYSDKISH